MMFYFSYIVMASFGILCRLPFSLGSNISTSDNAGVKAKLNALRKHGFSYIIPNAVNLGGFFPRPILFHFLVSKFPKKLWRITLVLLNSSFDVFAGMMSVGLIVMLFPGQISLEAQILLFGIAITSPILFPATARLKATNNRTFGLFLNQVYFAIFLGFDLEVWSVLALSLIVIITIISSTFATQLLFFVSLIYSLISLNYNLLIPLLLALIVVFALNPLGSRDILLFKWVHLKFTAKTQNTAFSVSNKALFFNATMLKKARKPDGFVDLILHRSGIIKLIWGLPSMLVLLFMWIDSGRLPNLYAEAQNELFSSIVFLILTVLIIFILTSFGKGRLVGESERYLEILSFIIPIGMAIIVAESLLRIDVLLLIFMGQIAVILAVSILNTSGVIEKISGFNAGFNSYIVELIDCIKASEKRNIATIPIRLSRTLSTHLDEQADDYRFYYRLICEKPILEKGIDRFLEDSYHVNFLKTTPRQLQDKYGVEMIILENRFIKGLSEGYWDSIMEECSEFHSNEHFSLFVIKS